MSEPLYELWEDYGVKYGYPSCCRLMFALRKEAPPRSKLTGTGYVTCSCCDNLPSELLIQRVNRNRSKSEERFPLVENIHSSVYFRLWIDFNTLPPIYVL